MDKLKRLLKYWYIPAIPLFIGLIIMVRVIVTSNSADIPTIEETKIKKQLVETNTNKIDDFDKKNKGIDEVKKESKDEVIKQNFNALDISPSNTNKTTKTQNNTEQISQEKIQTEAKNNQANYINKGNNANSNSYVNNQNNTNSKAVNSYQNKIVSNTNTVESKTEKNQKKKDVIQENKSNFDPFGTVKSGSTNTKQTNSKQTVSNKSDNTEIKTENNKNGLLRGEVYGNQTFEDNGSCVFRLKQSVNFNGTLLPINSLLYGKAMFTGKRVNVHLHLCKAPQGNFNVSFDIVDSDYLEGIYYKSHIDKGVDKTKQDASDNVLDNSTIKGKLINAAVKNISNAAISQSNESINLEDGYVVYFQFPKQK